MVGEAVRFRFDINDTPCVAAGGRCRSYLVTAPSDGTMDVSLKAVSGDGGSIVGLELYVVPGADSWTTGPGAQIGASLRVRTGRQYEIRMYAPTVPSAEMELSVSMRAVPPPIIPSIPVGTPIQFHFGPEDACPTVGLGGCRSYNVTPAANGEMQVDLKVISGNVQAIYDLELYVVPGADYWDVGPGARIGATVAVRAGITYEIRMGAGRVPTEELELVATMR
jgi:hypothetical protein